MISSHRIISVMYIFVTLLWAHIVPVEPNLKVITLTPSTDHLINNVTQNFSLECAFNSRIKPWQTSMTQILRIRILKSDSNDRRELMAEIGRREDGVSLNDNVLVRGQIKGDMWTSYLNITWPIVTATTFGKYQCDVLGYDTNLNYMSEKSNSVKLADCQMETEEAFNRFQHVLDRETGMMDEKIKLMDEKLKLIDKSIIYEKEDMESKVNDLYKKLMDLNESLGQNLQSRDDKFSGLISTVNKSIKNTMQFTDEKFNSLNSTLTASFEHKAQSMDEKVNFVKEQLLTLNKIVQYIHPYRLWPEGNYSLLEPLTGCPQHDDWRKGYHKLHTESGKTPNQNEVSSPSHLPADTLTSEGGKHYVTLNFCTKVRYSGISWPTGSYCINARGAQNSCPPGFDWTWIHMELERTGHNSSNGGYTPYNNPSSKYNYYYLNYCCRSDGPATTPIYLPTADPFYLYRLKGTCQSVTNMQVSNEYVIIDTEDTESDDYYCTYCDKHPDGSLDPVRLELCYYTPK